MAIVLKREDKRSGGSSLLKLKSLLSSKLALASMVFLLGGASMGAGFYLAKSMGHHGLLQFSSSLPSRGSPELAASKSRLEVKAVQEEGAKIWAALSAKALLEPEAEKGALISLSPGYLPSILGEAPEYLQLWKFADGLLFRTVSPTICEAILQGKPTPVLYGDSGLNCAQIGSNYVAAYEYKAAHRATKVLWPLKITGQFRDGLTVWQINATSGDDEGVDCTSGVSLLPEDADRVDELITLNAANPSYSSTLCLPAQLAEIAPALEGLSLYQGSDGIALKGYANRNPWHLELIANTCNQSMSSNAHLRFTFGTLTPLRRTGCDNSSLVHSPREPVTLSPSFEML